VNPDAFRFRICQNFVNFSFSISSSKVMIRFWFNLEYAIIFANWRVLLSIGVKLQRVMGHIQFVNVSFHYPSRLMVCLF
jgi:hypothetical protein